MKIICPIFDEEYEEVCPNQGCESNYGGDCELEEVEKSGCARSSENVTDEIRIFAKDQLSVSGEANGCANIVLPVLRAPYAVKTPTELRRLMMEDCPIRTLPSTRGCEGEEGGPHLTSRTLSVSSSSILVDGCPSETRGEPAGVKGGGGEEEEKYVCPEYDGKHCIVDWSWCAFPTFNYCGKKQEAEEKNDK